jgi:hypothetical protein
MTVMYRSAKYSSQPTIGSETSKLKWVIGILRHASQSGVSVLSSIACSPFIEMPPSLSSPGRKHGSGAHFVRRATPHTASSLATIGAVSTAGLRRSSASAPLSGRVMACRAAAAAVAIWSITSQTKNAGEDRRHDLLIRKQERRHSAYLELIALLYRLLTGVDRTAPELVQGQPIKPPPPLSDEESWQMNALADVVASDEVRNLMTAWTRKQSQFYSAVWYLQQVQQAEQQHKPPSETKAQYGVTSFEQWQKVDRLRKSLWADAEAIGARVRAEL